MTGRHGLVGLTGFGFIKGGVFVAAPGTGEQGNIGQRTDQTFELVTHSASPFRCT